MSNSEVASGSMTDQVEEQSLVKLVHWAPHGVWSWAKKADVCSICRNSLTSVCIECNSVKNVDDMGAQSRVCTVSWGVCDHAFHTHCIRKWLKLRTTCPVDSSDWEEKQISSAINA